MNDNAGTTAPGVTIFKATYSSVPVYEMPCQGVPVMRRKSDGWLNATQILKVAGFDKPQRTRVLEREVQKGVHEKVQGGYGKYQGTWVPLERGIALSKTYGVDQLLQPIFDFKPSVTSPPLAPKHITAVPVRNKKPKDIVEGKVTKAAVAAEKKAAKLALKVAKAEAKALAGGAGSSARGVKRAKKLQLERREREDDEDEDDEEEEEEEDEDVPKMTLAARKLAGGSSRQRRNDESVDDRSGSPARSGERGSSVSDTPSPVGSGSGMRRSTLAEEDEDEEGDYEEGEGEEVEMDDDDDEFVLRETGGGGPAKKRRLSAAQGGNRYPPQHSQQQQQQHHQQQQQHHQQQQQGRNPYPSSAHSQLGTGPLLYARMILDYFVSESTQVPPFLITPPADFDANVVIDDDGHTALHWACAMGRIRIVKLLLSAGADIYRANAIGQTALMRSAMFTNNYDLRKFPELFELLHRSTINIDRMDRTVFHYIVDIALQKGKTHAARYYLETVLVRLGEYPQEVADILNFQDEEGETALTLAARARSKRIVKILLDNGADPKIRNRDGKSAEDYILEDERFRENDDRAFQSGLIAITALNNPDPTPQSAQRFNTAAAAASASAPTSATAPNASILFAPQLHTSTAGQLASHTYVPQIATLLESLAGSFDTELATTQHDLTSAQSLLGTLQQELVESSRMIAAFKVQEQAEQWDTLQAREAELRLAVESKMGKRFRLGWEKWSRDEQARSESSSAGESALPVDLAELAHLATLTPEEQGVRSQEAVAKIEVFQAERQNLFSDLVAFQSEAGTGGKMREYRKLVALGCGVPVGEVDTVLPELLASLDS